ncbi:hypothetical protein [Georgenia sp. SYP-B2076]|uniref:hypothetical protein n=1 Tax=Georgenia sp. SYP-B2076 TaxID=2495881 RepID=UPI000F8D79A8|nr:hypothetical protein [Georgenia sp. SYP-B2076]
MTTASDTFHGPATEDFDRADVVTLPDVIQSVLMWTGALLAVAALVVLGGAWLIHKRRARADQRP